MKKLAKVLALVLAMAMVLGMFGCTKTEAPAATEPAAEGTTAAETAPVEEESNVVVDDTYSDMTSEELYELAKAEGGDINIYSINIKLFHLFQGVY